MSENTYSAADAQRDFQRGLSQGTPPTPPPTVEVPHPAKPSVTIGVPASEVPAVRRGLARRDAETRAHERRQAEQAAGRLAAERGDVPRVRVTTEDGTREMSGQGLVAFAKERFARLFRRGGAR